MVMTSVMILALAAGPEPEPAAVEVQAVRPDRQLERFLDLFEGTGWNGPAEVLAAWRRSGAETPSRTAQAVLTSLNRGMVREWRNLDRLTVRLEPGANGDWVWSVLVPRDDGSVSAVATALALTDGLPGPEIEGIRMDRLGPPRAPWMGRKGEMVVVASDREGVVEGLKRWQKARMWREGESGWYARVDAKALRASRGGEARRLGEVMGGLGIREVRGGVRIEEGALRISVRSALESGTGEQGRVDPEWLDLVPGDASAAVVWGVSGTSVDRWFAGIDAVVPVEEGEPRPAPARVRLNLLANAAGVRPEVEIWPRLRGVSGFVKAGESGRMERSVLVLHANGEESAERMAARVVPRLAGVLGQKVETKVVGRAVLVGFAEGSVGWVMDSEGDERRSAGEEMRSRWVGQAVSRCGAVWPGRWPGWVDEPSLEQALRGSPPVVWWGCRERDEAVETVVWPDLKGTVDRWVEAVPGTGE